MLRMDSELTLGHEWETVCTITYYNAAGVEVEHHQGRESYSVISVGPFDVIAGTFAVAAEVLHKSGPVGSVPYTFREYFAEGVGKIRQTQENPNFVTFELTSYGPLVAIQPTTWGRVKALYKN